VNLPNNKYSAVRWRLYVSLVVCSALPLLLFVYAADRSLRRTSIKNLLQQTGPAADLAAGAIEERLTYAKASLASLAADPALSDAWSRNDRDGLKAYLRTAHELKQEVASFAIYDANGVRISTYPDIDKQPQTNISSSDWFTAAMQARPYVSGVRSAESKQGLTVAVPINARQPAAVLAATYTIDTVQSWTKSVSPSAMKWISVVDQNGIIVAGAGLDNSSPLQDASSRSEVKQVLAGQTGTEFLWQNGKSVLVTRHPLPSLHWGVLVEIPAIEIDNAFWKAERPLAYIALVFLVLSLTIGIVIASLYRKLRSSEEHTRQIITAATDAFVAIDQQGVVTDWNPKAEELFGWTRAEAIGQKLHETIVPPLYRRSYLLGLKHFLATGEGPVLNKRLELSALHRDGHEFPVELSIAHSQRDGKNYFNAFLHDITKRKHAEKEIGTLNAELNTRVVELEERNKALEAFSYSVSHDVRAPLRNIAGFSEILHEEFAQQLTPAGLDYLGRIQTNVVRMQRLVDDLLRFARLGEKGLQVGPTDLNEIIREVVAGFESNLAGRKVTFEIFSLPIVDCDRGLVTQVFWNLLANAIKFTGTRSHAVVSVGESTQNGEQILFVRDNGVGFDMKHAGKLFAAFQRLHRSDEFEGTGVGLATVQSIVIKHQGRIWAESEPDQGATFFFSLQLHKAQENKTELAKAI
jgi:PAS domain S-box-containing protein